MTLPAAAPPAVAPTKILLGEEARIHAEALAQSTIVPPYFRGSIPNMMFAIELGNVYGLQAATVLQNIHVFETTDKQGRAVVRAGISASLMATLARRAGHIVSVSATPSKATATLVRGDSIIGKMLKGTVSPEELAHYSNILSTLKDMEIDAKKLGISDAIWNEDKAVTAGLFGKGNWKTYPHAMFAARAKTDVIRLGCDEVLIQLADRAHNLGEFRTPDGRTIDVSYTHMADELGASIDDDGTSFDVAPAASRPQDSMAPPRPSTFKRREQATVTPQEPPKKPEANEQVRNFVESSDGDKIATWAENTVANKDIDDATRKHQIVTVLNLVGSLADVAKTATVTVALCEMNGWGNEEKLLATVALFETARTQHLMDVMAHIAGQVAVTTETRLSRIQMVYTAAKNLGLTENAVTFQDFSGPLEKALKRCVAPLIQP